MSRYSIMASDWCTGSFCQPLVWLGKCLDCCARVANTLQTLNGFSFFLTSRYFCSWWFSIPFFNGLHIHLCDQCLGPFFPLLIKLAWHYTSLTIIVTATFSCCNCDMLSKASIDQNELQLIPSLILQWTLGFIALVPIYNVWHIFHDIPEWLLLAQTHAYEHTYVFLLSNFMTFFPNRVYADFRSQHLWTNVHLNNKNILILV